MSWRIVVISIPISHEYNEGVSIDTIKKSALNALNKPSYDIELGTSIEEA